MYRLDETVIKAYVFHVNLSGYLIILIKKNQYDLAEQFSYRFVAFKTHGFV